MTDEQSTREAAAQFWTAHNAVPDNDWRSRAGYNAGWDAGAEWQRAQTQSAEGMIGTVAERVDAAFAHGAFLAVQPLEVRIKALADELTYIATRRDLDSRTLAKHAAAALERDALLAASADEVQ